MVTYDKPAIQKTIDLFRKLAPSLVFTHAAKDYMMDHEMVSLLARNASFGYGAPNASSLPRRSDSTIPHLYYCDPVEGIDPLGDPGTPTTLVDITGQIDRKVEMLACHASQRNGSAPITAWMNTSIPCADAAARGQLAKTDLAEAFVQHRGHAYPRNDLLAELFPL